MSNGLTIGLYSSKNLVSFPSTVLDRYFGIIRKVLVITPKFGALYQTRFGGEGFTFIQHTKICSSWSLRKSGNRTQRTETIVHVSWTRQASARGIVAFNS